MGKNSTIDTKERIINAAEKLFASLGFAGTSLRGIVREADVNLAAIHYHFGSKEELFSAVVQRVVQPIMEEKLRLLTILEESDKLPSVAEILTAFVTPSLQMLKQPSAECRIHAQFIARCRTEPYQVQKLAEPEFRIVQQRFLYVLTKVLSNQSPAELKWKLDLVVAMLVRTMNQMEHSEILSEDSSVKDKDIDKLVQRLVTFISYGISA
ncbi:TetR/AcrR family transcriptional regulator [Okeania sp.]|uniref:TetR/AcrR family transcriptional regulator n=1 Tax=Okeania sp. TaxID=3100323 RepID=UPI002B4ACA11|nr:TetR/AcrR family transcriptional regulator [Okeania sp.]MEB3341093.1 TetR/AcrR family transcriptional regulator [Okeania sp.]